MISRFRVISSILILCLLCVACHKQKDLFVLRGEIYSQEKDSIIVLGFDTGFDKTDTIRFENGTFTYTLTPDTIVPLILFFSDGSQEVVFAEKGVSCQLQKLHPDSLCIINGSPLNDKLTEFKISAHNDTCTKQLIERIDSFILKDPLSQISPYLIYNYLLLYNNADKNSILDLLKKMSGIIQNNSFVTDLKATLTVEKNLPVYLPQVTVEDSTKTTQNLNDLTGKYILLYVWASWDEKSRHNRKALTEIEERYIDKKKELVIADISIDTKKERWKKALEEDSIEWSQFIDTNGLNSTFVRVFNIDRLPFYILLSGEKRILEYGYSLQPLTDQLDTTLTMNKNNIPNLKAKQKNE